MIFDTLENCKQYTVLHKGFEKGFEFLKNTDLKNLQDGKYEIDGNEIYANVQTLVTKQKDKKRWEVHRNYIDIQYVIKGRECMGYGLKKDFSDIEEKYDENKDIEFLKGDKYNYINVEEGDFIIFFPNDIHAPMLSIEDDIEIKKVIVKIKI